jgi:hypothetical protein
MGLEYYDTPLGTGIAEWAAPEPSWHEPNDIHKREVRELEEALGTILSTNLITPSIAEKFKQQADRWERETAFLSATPMRVLHESYQSIMAMGPEVVPILLRDLQKTRRHWFWALRHLTNADPVPEKDRGNVDKMVAAWLDWGSKEGKI